MTTTPCSKCPDPQPHPVHYWICPSGRAMCPGHYHYYPAGKK